jgi:hypothetical protein
MKLEQHGLRYDPMKHEQHGLRYHPLYQVWAQTKNRCYNKNDKRYKDYGGRGISVCLDWKHNPKVFIEWALTHGWKKGLCIDRINNDGNYKPDNCRFVTRAESNRNKRLLISTNTTGYCGVSVDSRKGKNPYKATIKINGKKTHLGLFPSPGLAALRYDVEAFLLDDGRPMNFIDRR